VFVAHDPFALPSPSAFAYRLLNIVSFLALITAFNYLALGGRQTVSLLLLGGITFFLCAGGIFHSARALARRATPVDARDADRLQKQFRPFADGVSFRQNEGEDARALELKSPTCVIGRKYVIALTSDQERRHRQSEVCRCA
jgi:hypothetical protein